jgi:type VI secretion system secreted protein Hcp
MGDITFTMKVSKASPKLFLACASGEHIKSVMLSATKSNGSKGNQAFLVWKFTDVWVSSFQVSSSGSNRNVP